MIDFLKAHPQVTKDEYLWEWTIPQIKLAIYDNTHVEYLTEEQAELEKNNKSTNKYDSAMSLKNDLGAFVI